MAANPFELQTSPTTSNKGLINSAGTFTQEQGGTNFAAIQPGTNSTVSGQLNGLLSTDSPYLKAARERSKRQANSRGLINSSIAAGAGEAAAIDAALPIAQQDASTFFTAQQGNQNAANNFLSQKNTFDFQSKEAGLDRGQALTLQGNQLGFQRDESALDRGQQLTVLDKQQTFQSGESALDRGQQLTVLDKQQGFLGSESALDRAQQSGLVGRELDANQKRLETELASRERLTGNENQLRKDLLNTQIQSEKDIATLQVSLNREIAAFNAELQDEQRLLDLTRGRNVSLQQSVATLSGQMLGDISQVLASEIDGAAKPGLVDAIRTQYQAVFDLLESMEGAAVLTEGQGGF